eukprot:9487450-Pyramimonas_sp.AAC.1
MELRYMGRPRMRSSGRAGGMDAFCGSLPRPVLRCCQEARGLSGGRSVWLSEASSGIGVDRSSDLFSTSLSLLSFSLLSSHIAA